MKTIRLLLLVFATCFVLDASAQRKQEKKNPAAKADTTTSRIGRTFDSSENRGLRPGTKTSRKTLPAKNKGNKRGLGNMRGLNSDSTKFQGVLDTTKTF